MFAYVGLPQNLKDLKDTPTKDLLWGSKDPSNINRKSFLEDFVNFGGKCPQNGSKYGSMAPATGLGCPHEGPSVVKYEKYEGNVPLVQACVLVVRFQK